MNMISLICAIGDGKHSEIDVETRLFYFCFLAPVLASYMIRV